MDTRKIDRRIQWLKKDQQLPEFFSLTSQERHDLEWTLPKDNRISVIVGKPDLSVLNGCPKPDEISNRITLIKAFVNDNADHATQVFIHS